MFAHKRLHVQKTINILHETMKVRCDRAKVCHYKKFESIKISSRLFSTHPDTFWIPDDF